VGDSTTEHGDIVQQCFFADNVENKDQILQFELSKRSYNQAIVFTATREDTDRIANLLNEQKLEAIALRGDMPQNQRAAVMSAFARGQHSILVTTDLASRGLDLSKVGLVVNFDLPKNADEYIHRIGRTGRAGQKGEAFSLIGPRDWNSFEGLKTHLQYALECSAHDEFSASFKGFTPKKKVSKKPGLSNGKKRTAKPAKSGVKKRVDTMSGEDIGMVPVKRKPRSIQSDDDDE